MDEWDEAIERTLIAAAPGQQKRGWRRRIGWNAVYLTSDAQPTDAPIDGQFAPLRTRTQMAIYVSAWTVAIVMTVSGGAVDVASMHVLIGGHARPVVVAAIAGAVQRLESPSCRRLLTDFAAESGRPLADNLASTGLTLPEYVSRLYAVEGDGEHGCANGTIRAFTASGSHVIHVCSSHFGAISEIVNAQMTFIHEILHTLGLGENPPSSAYISRLVAVRCRAYS